MKIAVIGANGRVGSKIVKFSLEKNYDVTAIIRHDNKTQANKVIYKDLFDLTKDDLRDFDVIVDAFGVWHDDQMSQHVSSLKHLIDILVNTKIRLIVVGGAGSLLVDKDKQIHLMDTPNFPDSFKLLASSMSNGLNELKKTENLRWTYISPAAEFQADGPFKNHYVIGNDLFTTDDNGDSAISYLDYAKAVVDEIEKDNYEDQQISFRW